MVPILSRSSIPPTQSPCPAVGPPCLRWPNLGGTQWLGQPLQTPGSLVLTPWLCICMAPVPGGWGDGSPQRADAPPLWAWHGQVRVHRGQTHRLHQPALSLPPCSGLSLGLNPGPWFCPLATLLCHRLASPTAPQPHRGPRGTSEDLRSCPQALCLLFPPLRSLPPRLCKLVFWSVGLGKEEKKVRGDGERPVCLKTQYMWRSGGHRECGVPENVGRSSRPTSIPGRQGAAVSSCGRGRARLSLGLGPEWPEGVTADSQGLRVWGC